MNLNYLGLLYPMLMLNLAIAVGLVRYRRRQVANVKRLRERQLEDFEAYKKEVAGELHDHFGSVKMEFAKLLRARKGEVDEGLADAIVDLEGQFSNINEILYPAGVETGNVGMLFQRLANTASAPALTVRYDGPEKLLTSPERALHIYRVIQETLSNAVRHSRPTSFVLRAEVGERNAWHVTCTYDTPAHETPTHNAPTQSASASASASKRRQGRGQSILASRLTLLNATRKVQSADDRRTETFHIPTAA